MTINQMTNLVFGGHFVFSHLTHSCRGDEGFVDYDSGGVSGHLQKNYTFSIFSRFPY